MSAAQPKEREVDEPRRIVGFVFGEDGKPVANTAVAVLGSAPQPLRIVTTDQEGRFEIGNIAEGTFTVRAGGDAAGLGTATAHVTRGDTPVRVDLQRGACVRGRVVRSTRSPHVPYRVSWRAADGSWCDETLATDHDKFVLANLPPVPGNVYVGLPIGGIPFASASSVLTDNGELLLHHDVEAMRSLSVEPVLPDGCAGARVEVRVWQAESGLGVIAQQPEAGKPFVIEHLPSGWYQVEVRAAGCGFVDLGRHWLDGKTDVDLGRVALPSPGRVTFTIPVDVLPENAEHRAFEVCELRSDLDVRVTLDEIPVDRPMLLPAGEYVFAFRHRDGGVRFQRFAVRAGEATTVTAQ